MPLAVWYRHETDDDWIQRTKVPFLLIWEFIFLVLALFDDFWLFFSLNEKEIDIAKREYFDFAFVLIS